MKILSLYYTHKPGGFCKRLYRLLSAAARRGHEVHYLTLDEPPSTLDENVKVHLIPFLLSSRRGLLFWLFFTLWCPLYCSWKALKIAPEQYVVFGAYYACMYRLARIFHAAPLVLFVRALSHKINMITGKNLLVRTVADMLDAFGIKSATRVVCISNAMKESLEDFLNAPLRDTFILPNDVPQVKKSLAVFKEKPIESAFIVLTAGVIDERKNIDFLLYTFSALQKEHGKTLNDICLLVAGDGPRLDRTVALAEELELENVRFLGWVDDLSHYYRSATLMLHPSLHEGAPNAVLEALAYDLPVLVSDIPELRELMDIPELTFDLLEYQLLAERLIDLSSNSNSLSALKASCALRAQALSFDWDSRALEALSLK